mmetsp:Transcript_100735/g.197699  ORF Transcript_100735/g.197699 Transcript_100735/m.197699 type:complete len:1133 (-) Transcript_100735:708-4106(-)
MSVPMSNSAIMTTSSSSLNSYSAVSTLERQCLGPLGQRLIVGVQANAACCLEGGVEAIIKLRGNSSDVSSEAATIQSSFEESKDDDFDAFGFLQENETVSPATNQANGAGKNRLGGFIRKVAASTSATLERQMQGLALRIDKGRNPDLLRVAMYDLHTEELLGVTEPLPLEGRKDMRFRIPLVVTGRRRQQQFRIKLWIQSGAALLQRTKAATHYLLGQATVDCSKLALGSVTPVLLSSNLVVGAQIDLCALEDPKFSQLFQRGWSLSDPDMSAYSSDLCHLPLDQSYVFAGKKTEHWLVAIERATESSVTLPIGAAVMELAARAAQKSLRHAQSVSNILRNNRHDSKDETKASCSVGIIGIEVAQATTITAGVLTVAWRRPDSIFELELITNEKLTIATSPYPDTKPQVQMKFFPKVCTEGVLPGILQAFGGQMPATGFLLGALCFCVMIQSDNEVDIWEAIVGIESFVGNGNNNACRLPLHRGTQLVGHLLVQLQVMMPTHRVTCEQFNGSDGLVSLVGLESLAYGVNPIIDNDVPRAQDDSLRKQQLDTMGLFFTSQYMDQHLALRHSAMEGFQERARAYKQALFRPEKAEPHQLRSPKAFRPSSSRMETTLSGLPFNCHVVQMNINVVDSLRTAVPCRDLPGACFQNVTHGAPSDHARGFGNVLAGVSSASAAGGLRRLEAKRTEFAQVLQQAQDALIAGVGNYFAVARKRSPVNHISARNSELQQLRWRVFEAVQNLHHLTWMCAVRRANVFSQSLGLAVTSYLASLSDTSKITAGWPEIWKRHGYLVCFEGLLSAAGKELGMIEDASVAICMLRMVRIVLMPDNGIPSKAVFVPSSPFVKWVNLFPSGQGQTRHFLLQIGIDPNYYNERVPVSLRNGTAIQLYPILYQMGVDIRQHLSYTGQSLMSKQQNGATQDISTGGIVDGEDDDVGVVDTDVLVALNFEAFEKMNVYAHAVWPEGITLDRIQAGMGQAFTSNLNPNTAQDHDALPPHPALTQLQSHIMASAGKIYHGILDEAATLAQRLGGGSLVFCKSGKDRTAMHVTYKQAQFVARYRGECELDEILSDASLLRTYGTRLPICEKNVGQAKYAFNSLQVQFMPDTLKPPMNTLAGFLKGGRLFGEGPIES